MSRSKWMLTVLAMGVAGGLAFSTRAQDDDDGLSTCHDACYEAADLCYELCTDSDEVDACDAGCRDQLDACLAGCE